MSSENLLEFASSFEVLYNATTKLIEELDLGKVKMEQVGTAKENLTELDYFINQMELELSLMPPEDSDGVEINKTCRGHYNDLRKKIENLETFGPAQKKKKGKKLKEKDENDILGVESTSINFEDVDSSRQNLTSEKRKQRKSSSTSDDHIDDLRTKYGIPASVSLFSSETDEEAELRKHRVRKQRLMMVGVFLGACLLLFLLFKIFLGGSSEIVNK